MAPGDPLELEAEKLAIRAVREPAPHIAPSPAAVHLQRKCAECQEDDAIRRSPSAGTAAGDVDTDSELMSRIAGMRGGGIALPSETRRLMESRLSHDFGHVRLHVGGDAAAAAAALSADAFTVGNDIFFAAGKFSPASPDGQRLLAHELVHVIQQARTLASPIVQRAPSATPAQPSHQGDGKCKSASKRDPLTVGNQAHEQIREYLIKQGRVEKREKELVIPRASKSSMASTKCQSSSTSFGRADLYRLGDPVLLAEIKPRASAASATDEVAHYIRRAGESMDRLFPDSQLSNANCNGMEAKEDDQRFVKRVDAEGTRKLFAEMNDILTSDTPIGQFEDNADQVLHAQLVAPGAVEYWCTSGTGTGNSALPASNSAPVNPTGTIAYRLTANGNPVTLMELTAGREVTFEAGPQLRPIATGTLNVTTDEGGLVLAGTLAAHLPCVDKADGELTYRNREWSGGISIASSQIGIPGIQSGQLNVGFTNEGVSVDGEVTAALPGGNVVTFRAQRSKTGDYVYEGIATLQVPGLKPVDVQIQYDGHTFHGEASTNVALGPLSGKVKLEYAADGDKGTSDLSGKGTLTIKNERVDGTFAAKVANGVLTGNGRVRVQLTKSLGGQVGITLDEKQRLRVSGGVTVAGPIEIFPRVPKGGGHKELFNNKLDIPIVGVTLGPLGSIGLIAQISAGLGVNYHFGPGTLDKIQLGVAFNPLEDNVALTADGHAELDIPAYAGVYLRLRGALGLSAAVASVTGGIEAVAELGLQGAARSVVDLHYAKGGFSLEGVTRISANPVVRLSLDANVIAEAGAFGVSYEWRKDWKLASVELGSSWELGLEAKLGYSSSKGVQLPAPGEIRWIYPKNIDPAAILNALMKRVMG
jgi:hypothetical protein